MSSNPSLAASPRVEDWIAVRPDDVVEVRSGKVEIGQRITTAVALVAARELGVPFDRIVMVPPRTGVSPDEGYTSGSNSMEQSGRAVRLAAATARRELIARAAKRLGVDAATLEVRDGLVRSRETNRTLRFGELVEDAPLALPIDPDASASAPDSRGRGGAARARRAARPARARDRHARASSTTSAPRHAARPGRPPAALPRHPDRASRSASRSGARRRKARARRQLPRGGGEDEHLAIRAAARVAAAARWNTRRGLDERPICGAAPRQPARELSGAANAGRARSRCPSRRRTGRARSARSTSVPTRCTPRSRRRPRSPTSPTAC